MQCNADYCCNWQSEGRQEPIFFRNELIRVMWVGYAISGEIGWCFSPCFPSVTVMDIRGDGHHRTDQVWPGERRGETAETETITSF